MFITDSRSDLKSAIQQVFVQTDSKSTYTTWREVVFQLDKRNLAVTAMIDEVEADVLAYFGFHKAHRVKIHSTNTLERRNKKVKRCADVVSIFTDADSICGF